MMELREAVKPPSWVGWVGDMDNMNQYLYKTSWWSPWAVLKFINAMIRSIGVVSFANNPVTGVLILTAMFIENTDVAIGCLMCVSIALVLNKIIGASDEEMRDGVCCFNCVLLGSVVTSVAPSVLQKQQLDASFWIMLAFAAVITCYVDQGMNAMMAPSGLPAQSIAFNIVGALLILTLQSYYQTHRVLEDTQSTTARNYTDVNWGDVMKATLLSGGQIYGLSSVTSSSLVWLSFLIFSPLLTLCFYIGSVIGAIGAVIATSAPLPDIYLGLWSYNAMLTTGGISYFLLPSISYFGAIIIGAIMTLAAQVGCGYIFSPNNVPLFSFPFNIVIAVIIGMSRRKNPQLIFVDNRRFHEFHIYHHYYIKPMKTRDENIHMNISNG